jgi:hypothetical protein
MSDVVIETREGGAVVCFIQDERRVVVDARAHDLSVEVTGHRPQRVAASRAGFAHAVFTIEESFEAVSFSFHDDIERALKEALFAAARRRGVDIEPVFSSVNSLYSTVFPCCRGIVENSYLHRDVRRFPAAAAAVGGIEDDAVRDRTVPEQTDAWAFRLREWRSLYVHPLSSARSVNRTLSLYGDDAAPSLLWGLRRVVMTAPLPSIQHVEVLGALGMLGDNLTMSSDAARIDPHFEAAILKASAQQLGEALVLVDEAESAMFSSELPAVRLAEVLTGAALGDLWDDPRGHLMFPTVFAEALHGLKALLGSGGETMPPPIAPPESAGIVFLGTVGAILQEGTLMGHCVATRAPRALAGLSYLFHIEHAGAKATAEVSREGKLLEVRGPHNTDNAAVVYATRELQRWAARVAWLQLGPPKTSVWTTPGPATIPPGYVPIRTLGELQDALASFTAHNEPGDAFVRAWAERGAADAIAGKRWFVAARVDHVTFQLALINAQGAMTQTATDTRERAAQNADFEEMALDRRNRLHLPPRQDDQAMPDVDLDDWDTRT